MAAGCAGSGGCRAVAPARRLPQSGSCRSPAICTAARKHLTSGQGDFIQMCGRYAFLLPHESWRGLYKVLNDFDYVPHYNITPTQPIVTILEREGRRTAELFRWGFVP